MENTVHPCENKGWGFQAGHCAPPVGYNKTGLKCKNCPWTNKQEA